MTERSQLQACKRCRTRKAKCSKSIPRCNTCEKVNMPCIFVDTATGDEYTREQIAELEEQESLLRSVASEPDRVSDPAPGSAPIDEGIGTSGLNTDRSDTFVGDASGINVLEAIFSDQRFYPERLKRLLVRRHIPQLDVAPANLPLRETAEFLFQTYLNESNVQRPIINRADAYALLHLVYDAQTNECHANDTYTFYMICAISAVPLRRRGLILEHPYSFYLAANTVADQINVSSGMRALSNLLLLARFAVYFHTGVSTWEIGRICIRLCVNMNLHLPPWRPLSPLQEQQQRKIFWESYLLDRHTSTILGRPFAIADEDIEVALPVDVDDDQLLVAELGQLDLISIPTSSPGPLAVSLAFIRLRKITSKVHYAFFTRQAKADTSSPMPKRAMVLAEIFATFYDLSEELENWRGNVPDFPSAHTFYQKQEWYDFLLQKERLLLVRGAMHALPSQKGPPPKELRRICCDCTNKLINLYGELYWTKDINCTRHYFQILFTAGLLLAYFSPGGLGDPDRSQATFDADSTKETLIKCRNLLNSMSAEMHDATPYASVFEMICGTACPNWRFDAESDQTTRRAGDELNTNTEPRNLNQADDAYADMQRISNNYYSTGWPDGPYPETDQQDWSYSPGHLLADMETYVSQFATGDFAVDPLLESLSWNPSLSADGFSQGLF